ncbi:hypothetical protein FRB94_009506 [Tulasnella sp. JGI-2019a]|nr:hypothetical protein FRB94_009506 [Tulasnella sp. JGI-2019a]KAG9003145.1 hypothetical protein FRB93_011225 [Tulasnella sp. JGI-2019a]KAG9033989.1 hypothetical protein FRB95_013962 [Tulasnella sp. JGI-2019a]
MAAPYATPAFAVIPPLMTDESFVNGVWAHILGTYFLFPDFVIEPEKYTPRKNRADLYVHKIQGGRAMLCYEGKVKGGQDATFGLARAQAGVYMDETRARFGMVGIGREVVFITPQGSDLWDLKIDRSGKPVPVKGHNPLDILNDSAAIHTILTAIRNQPLT